MYTHKTLSQRRTRVGAPSNVGTVPPRIWRWQRGVGFPANISLYTILWIYYREKQTLLC